MLLHWQPHQQPQLAVFFRSVCLSICQNVCVFFWLSFCLLSSFVSSSLSYCIYLSSGSFFYQSKVTVSFLVYLSVYLSSSFNWLGKINCRPPNLSGEVSTTARVSVNKLYIFVSMFLFFLGKTFFQALKGHELSIQTQGFLIYISNWLYDTSDSLQVQ